MMIIVLLPLQNSLYCNLCLLFRDEVVQISGYICVHIVENTCQAWPCALTYHKFVQRSKWQRQQKMNNKSEMKENTRKYKLHKSHNVEYIKWNCMQEYKVLRDDYDDDDQATPGPPPPPPWILHTWDKFPGGQNNDTESALDMNIWIFMQPKCTTTMTMTLMSITLPKAGHGRTSGRRTVQQKEE